LLLINDTLGAPPLTKSGLCKLLTVALKKGVPLATWPIELPGDEKNPGTLFEENLKENLEKLFHECSLLAQTPERFRNARKSQPWARRTALFWDDDDNDKNLNFLGEEPSQL
jgi:hypothetical protein